MTLYGDLVWTILYVPIVLLHAWKTWTIAEDDAQRSVACAVTTFFLVAGILCYVAWWKNNSTVSNLALVANLFALSFTNLKQWSFDDECAIVPQFLGLLITLNANIRHSLRAKILQVLLIFAVGYGVISMNPLVELDDALPFFAVATAMELVVLWILSTGIDGFATVHAARIVLASIFTWHVANEVWVIFTNPDSATVGSLAIVKAAFFAAVGLTAAGTFRREMDVKESFEVLVEERTKEIRQQAQRLVMMELALQASETAIAIIEPTKTITWRNPALERLCKECSLKPKCTLVEALRLKGADARKMDNCFHANHSQELEEIVVGNSILNVEISPFPHTPETREFPTTTTTTTAVAAPTFPSPSLLPEETKNRQIVVVLKDVTAERARIRAEKAAEQKTLLAKAMSESIEVVSHELRTPLQYTPSGSKIVVQCRIQARSAISNAIESALAAGEEVANPTNSTDVDEEKVMVFAVVDEGQGIAAGQEKKIFRKFSQLDSEQKHKLGGNTIGQPSGTGLGLNLCLRFIQLMKGNIWVSNNVSGPGVTFSFYLPLVCDEKKTPDLDPTRTDSPSAPRPSFIQSSSASKYRVLLVDDTLINRKVFHRMLKRIGVAAIETVDSGRKALGLLEKGDFNLVISDIQMPEMSGTELSEKIHSNQKITKKPVVVGLTADTSKNINERCAASGMADVLHKPLTVVEMYDYFENVVDRLVPLTQQVLLV